MSLVPRAAPAVRTTQWPPASAWSARSRCVRPAWRPIRGSGTPGTTPCGPWVSPWHLPVTSLSLSPSLCDTYMEAHQRVRYTWALGESLSPLCPSAQSRPSHPLWLVGLSVTCCPCPYVCPCDSSPCLCPCHSLSPCSCHSHPCPYPCPCHPLSRPFTRC